MSDFILIVIVALAVIASVWALVINIQNGRELKKQLRRWENRDD
ncbi:hypothetical protein DFO66_103346 [Brevibacterium sanguinis]|uniref:Uncharacterized protein n=2 Tax=Brevibacterium TaxID=1696 RepID=A0A366IMF5_9MICO|nr:MULTISPECIES: hypothetical protein [Brevibacterium]RBP66399.1 hypothetical protein DFO66_103346 [Brevibacterium sanguinis]RBP73051.1 hypothetical protein DFO65_103346 [Brevibacterium celere]